MDVAKTTSQTTGLMNAGAIQNKDALKGGKDKDQTETQKATDLLSGADRSTEEGRKTIQQKASKIDAKMLMQEYALQFQAGALASSQNNFSAQATLSSGQAKDIDTIRSMLASIDADLIGYKGKPLATLTPEEAKELVSDGGFFSVDKTAERIADFVVLGAGENIEKLKKGREGVIKGYEEAQKIWGGELPEISQESYKKALEKIDQRINDLLGGEKSALDAQA